MDLEGVSGKSAILRLGKTQFEIFEFSNPFFNEVNTFRKACDFGIYHVCFDVDNIDEEYERLSSKGVVFHCQPQDFGGAKAVYGRGSDGNIFELIEMVDSSL